MNDVTVILNAYKRPQHLAQQLEAINTQTVKPSAIMLWQNAAAEVDAGLAGKTLHANSNHNFGVWARFAYALNAKTEFVCVFDDDTMPGNMWLENCLNTIKEYNGLLGTIGVIFKPTGKYDMLKRVGWDGNNEQTTRVDIVGHSWFFRREWLSYFWRELPPMDGNFLVGEDIHFSAMLQRYGGINTYVPPHPPNNKKLWGSIPETAWAIGQDSVAISGTRKNMEDMNNAYMREISNGFRIIAHKEALYKQTLYDVFAKITSGANFALVRVADGERYVLEGKQIRGCDGWETKNEVSRLGVDLKESLNHKEENYLFFASCPCCDKVSHNFYKKILPKEFHSSNVFVNDNYSETKAFLLSLKRDVVLIVNEDGKDKPFGNCKVIGGLFLPNDCVNYWEDETKRESTKTWVRDMAKKCKNTLFIVAVGPMSEPLIHEAYLANPENQYIDFGSSVDEIIHGKKTRPFMDAKTHYAKLICNY